MRSEELQEEQQQQGGVPGVQGGAPRKSLGWIFDKLTGRQEPQPQPLQQLQQLQPMEPKKCLVVTEVANTVRHKNQFRAVFHPSWRQLLSHPSGGIHSVDILAYCEPGACRIMPEDCREVKDNEQLHPGGAGGCHFHHLAPEYVKASYKYGLSLTFMTSDSFAEVAKQYDYVMRSDADAVLMPGLRQWVPEHGSAVGKGYMGAPFTHKRLQEVAGQLHMNHHGVHGMQSTFYVRASKIVPFAKELVRLSDHFFEHEFTQEQCREVVKQGGECSWPKWYQQVSTLYATDLVANSLLGEPDFSAVQVTEKLDQCATDCWSDEWKSHGDLAKSKFKARELAQAHLLQTKHHLGKGFLKDEHQGRFCRLASETWPNYEFPRTKDWGTADESAQTYFMRVLSTSLPSMCEQKKSE